MPNPERGAHAHSASRVAPDIQQIAGLPLTEVYELLGASETGLTAQEAAALLKR